MISHTAADAFRRADASRSLAVVCFWWIWQKMAISVIQRQIYGNVLVVKVSCLCVQHKCLLTRSDWILYSPWSSVSRNGVAVICLICWRITSIDVKLENWLQSYHGWNFQFLMKKYFHNLYIETLSCWADHKRILVWSSYVCESSIIPFFDFGIMSRAWNLQRLWLCPLVHVTEIISQSLPLYMLYVASLYT